MSKMQSEDGLFIAANVVGICFYLLAASLGWVEPELADMPGASGGGAILWFFLAVPILCTALLTNVAITIWALVYRWRNRRWYYHWGALMITAVLWMLAVTYDFSRHGV